MTIKVSIITVVYNRVETIAGALRSFQNQSYKNKEHIIIDGESFDGTVEVIKANISGETIFISERDNGVYSAINKGIRLSSGDIIGLLHSDDCFAYDDLILDIVNKFKDENIESLYADLVYVDKLNNEKIIRKWRASNFDRRKLHLGWMPPHPTLFLKNSVYSKIGLYDERNSISSDYDLMLKYFKDCELSRVAYLPKVAIKMRLGGVSNGSIQNIFKKMLEDYRIIKKHQIGGLNTLILKNIKKINQFIHKNIFK